MRLVSELGDSEKQIALPSVGGHHPFRSMPGKSQRQGKKEFALKSQQLSPP